MGVHALCSGMLFRNYCCTALHCTALHCTALFWAGVDYICEAVPVPSGLREQAAAGPRGLRDGPLLC